MKKFAAFIMAILMVSQTAYAETAKTDSYNIHFDTDVFYIMKKQLCLVHLLMMTINMYR